MVLRKNPPPGIQVPSRPRNGSDPKTPLSRSSASPRSATQQSSRKDSWELDTESIYSPDLHTSPAFDLMPLEEAQKSPVAGHSPWEDELVERPAGMTHVAATTLPETADKTYGDPTEMSHQQTGSSAHSDDEHRKQSTAEDSVSGTSPQRFRSNNPFLRARNSSPNPWEDASQRGVVSSQGSSVSSLHQDFSGRDSQTSGVIPMTARLSIFDQPEDPWNRPNHQLESEPAIQTSLDKGKQPAPVDNSTTNQYLVEQAGQDLDSKTHWQELTLRGDSDPANGSNTSASQYNPRTASPQLIDLEDTPTNTEANPWSSEKQPATPQKDEEQLAPTSDHSVSASEPLPPMTEAELKNFQEKQAETYAIRHVNWTDSTGQLRKSPVLVQSQNGPCPLLALVNGLVMRSDRNAQPPIVRALQTREHISLGLLIQALFDELVTYSSEELPDIEALSRFLTMLHTGMNVNPRLTLGSAAAVGSFYETKDLQLYDSFKVPLVHGWVAAPSSDVHKAMTRVAQYYEDIQLLQFRKEELEDRVVHSGSTLSTDEVHLMNDIHTIDHFVNIENTTQLTKFGLDHLSKTLPPGSVSILFRNDHFSTLYKHPQSGQLFTLITDAGYADHAEVVWESLVDITGAEAEFYAGDFRPVGHGPSGPDVAGASNLVSQRTSSRNHTMATSTTTSQQDIEQADADYAYALSLQFQEEAQQQQQQRQRQQHARSSSNRISSTSSNSAGRTTVPAHRYSQSAASSPANRLRKPSASSSIQSPSRNNVDNLNDIPQDAPTNADGDDDLADDAPPPTYEQVARNKAAEILKRQQQQRQQFSPAAFGADYEQRGQYPGAAASTGRRQQYQTVPDRSGRSARPDKDCILM